MCSPGVAPCPYAWAERGGQVRRSYEPAPGRSSCGVLSTQLSSELSCHVGRTAAFWSKTGIGRSPFPTTPWCGPFAATLVRSPTSMDGSMCMTHVLTAVRSTCVLMLSFSTSFHPSIALKVGHHLCPPAGSGPSKHRCRAESYWGHCADAWVALYMRVVVKLILLDATLGWTPPLVRSHTVHSYTCLRARAWSAQPDVGRVGHRAW